MKKYLLFLLFALATVVCYTSCSDDDDNFSSTSVEGTWVGYSDGVGYNIVMNSNGGGTIQTSSVGAINKLAFSYTYSGTTLNVESGNNKDVFTVVIASNGRSATVSDSDGNTFIIKRQSSVSPSAIIGIWKGTSEGYNYTITMDSKGNGTVEVGDSNSSASFNFTYTYDGATLIITSDNDTHFLGVDIADNGKTAVCIDEDGDKLNLTKQ